MNDQTAYHALYARLQAEKSRRQDEKSRYDWQIQARASQKVPSGTWRIWLILAGRGFGKTRTGAETVRLWVASGQARRICLLGHTYGDVENVMIGGHSGLLEVCPADSRPVYKPSQKVLLWPNGARAGCYSATAYEKLRGPQFDAAWVDELAKFPHPQEAWDQLMMGLRVGDHPRVVVTTTPRPLGLLKQLLHHPEVHVTTGSTFENSANLSPSYLKTMTDTYAQTALGRQEIEGLVVDCELTPLWTEEMLARALWPPHQSLPPFKRIVVGVDPAVTASPHTDETGIIVAGLTEDGYAIVLDDLSEKMAPLVWAQRVVEAFTQYQADAVVAEVNNGGDLVQKLLETVASSLNVICVRATRGKYLRAEPVAALYAQGRVFHGCAFPVLVEQLRTFPHKTTGSPDRLDALVWALTDLMGSPTSSPLPQVWNV